MTIALYGATGYTGRLVVDELRRLELPFVLGGRDPAKLAELSEASGGASWHAAATDDPAALAALVADAKVLINCAGPFEDLGEPVVQAAIAGRVHYRVHYLDSTGEQPSTHALGRRSR